MDGVVGLTQCSIAKSQKFTYQFRIDEDQAGTFWYHGHSGTQRADGLYGGLVVHKPAANQLGEVQSYQYDAEQLFLIGDWYHRRGSDVLAWYEDFGHFGAEVSGFMPIIRCVRCFQLFLLTVSLGCTGFAPDKWPWVLRLRHGCQGTAS